MRRCHVKRMAGWLAFVVLDQTDRTGQALLVSRRRDSSTQTVEGAVVDWMVDGLYIESKSRLFRRAMYLMAKGGDPRLLRQDLG